MMPFLTSRIEKSRVVTDHVKDHTTRNSIDKELCFHYYTLVMFLDQMYPYDSYSK